MAFTILHTAIGRAPSWYLLETCPDQERAKRRAYDYALDHGGYVCVRDSAGGVVFGTDPAALDRAISSGINHNFPLETARRRGCCVS